MNWKRGLLRLWAVAAVLWVGVAFYSGDTWQRVRDVHDPYAAFSSPVAPRDLLADAPSPPADNRYAKYAEDTSAAAPLKPSIWPPLFDFAKLAFIPPLLLLALGYIAFWVGRGFRR